MSRSGNFGQRDILRRSPSSTSPVNKPKAHFVPPLRTTPPASLMSEPDVDPALEKAKNGERSNGRVEDDFATADPAFVDLSTRELTKFQKRLKSGKVRLCNECGEVMTKSTRMVLSPFAGLVLVILGTLHMAAYGFATNFYESPWFLTFVLPSVYYVGSIFIGVGVVFFFVRERVWKCRGCREVRKR